jgi:hypothetical protein
MTTQKAARASPELRRAPISPCYRRNYTTPRGTTLVRPRDTIASTLRRNCSRRVSFSSSGRETQERRVALVSEGLLAGMRKLTRSSSEAAVF